jgi:NifB/MoaA-like Fe-S oxidoreductase
MRDEPQRKSTNPKRANRGRYCGQKNLIASGKLSHTGRDLDKLHKDDAGNIRRKPSGELTQLRKKAKAMGVEAVNRKSLDELRELVPKLEAEQVKVEEPKAEPKVENEPQAEPEAQATPTALGPDEIKAQIKALGGKLPRGRSANDPEKLMAALAEAKGE